MASYDTNILNGTITDPDVLTANLTSRYTDTFFSATSTLSSSNFRASTTLSAASTTVLGITPATPLSAYNIIPTQNLSVAQFTSLATLLPTASATDKTVYNTRTFFLTSVGATHVELISAGTINGQQVYGIAFNKRTPELTSLSAATSTTTLSAYSGVKFRVNNAYEGATMAFILADRSLYEFTVVTGSAQTTGQLLTAANAGTYPEVRRLWTLGYV